VSRATYKGYQIETVPSGGSWTARIYPPASKSELPGPFTATLAEGEQVLLGRAYDIVDREFETQSK